MLGLLLGGAVHVPDGGRQESPASIPRGFSRTGWSPSSPFEDGQAGCGGLDLVAARTRVRRVVRINGEDNRVLDCVPR